MPITINRNLTPDRRTGGVSIKGKQVKSVTLEDLHATLSTMARGCHDLKVKGREITFNEDGSTTIHGKKYTWTDHSFSQFCAKLKLPTEFLRRCPNGSGPSGKKGIVDFWKEQADAKNFFLRVRDLDTPDPETGAHGYLRATMTDRYGVMDNLELLSMMEPFIKKHSLYLHLGQATDKSFHMRLLFPDEVDVTGGGDMHQAGLHVTNSEVGFSNLQGDFLLYRQVCQNGLMTVFDGESMFYQRHVNIDRHEVRAGIQAALENVGEKKEQVYHKVTRSIEQVVARPLQELKRVLKNGRATDDFLEMAQEAYDAEPVATRFGITQAITRAAHRLTLDQRVSMENIAGAYLMAT